MTPALGDSRPLAAKESRRSLRQVLHLWDRVSIYLPVLLMGALALGTYWLVRNSPVFNAPEAAKEARHESDYFMRLFTACGLDPVPADWRARVLVGSDRRQSSTARENLAGGQADLPDELPEIQKRLIEYAAPGLRPLLGYGQA